MIAKNRPYNTYKKADKLGLKGLNVIQLRLKPTDSLFRRKLVQYGLYHCVNLLGA